MISVRWLLAHHLPSQAAFAISWHQRRFFSRTGEMRFSVRSRITKRLI
jgi:sigma-70-like protein